MATLDQLKARIKMELDRDDMDTSDELETALSDAITSAIEYHADEQFWFNVGGGTVNTAIGAESVTAPATVRRVTKVMLGGVPLKRVRLESLQGMAAAAAQGTPRIWSGVTDTVSLYPNPDAIYALLIIGVAEEPALTTGASTNDWTTYGYDLIAATARKTLYRDVLMNPDAASAAAAAETEFLEGLRAETVRRRKEMQ